MDNQHFNHDNWMMRGIPFIVYVFNYIAHSEGLVLEYPKVTETQTVINVTGCRGWGQFKIAVFEEKINWFEAQQQCVSHGYNGLESSVSNDRHNAIIQLINENVDSQSKTPWVGYFRPFPPMDSWYTPKCKDVGNNKFEASEVALNQQCAFINYAPSLLQTLNADDCFKKRSYVCSTIGGYLLFHVYDGFDLSYVPSSLTYYTLLNHTLKSCAEILDVSDVSFIFNYVTGECLIYKFMYGYGQVQYNLTKNVANAVAHGVRVGCEFKFVKAPAVPTTLTADGNYHFPECNVTPIPDGYCPIENKQDLTQGEMDAVVNEIVKNLTVDPDETSKHRRRHESADDNRSSAKFMGTVGILCIVVCFGLPIYLDISYHIRKLRQQKIEPAPIPNTEVDIGLHVYHVHV